MIPILYDREYYPGNFVQIGKLPGWRELTVTEERNGEFVLEGDLKVGSLNADRVGVEMVIRCAVAPVRADYGELQPFRIQSVTKPPDSDELHIVANHISYQLREYLVSPSFSYRDTSVQDILDELNNPSYSYITPVQGLFGFHSSIETANPIQPEPDEFISVRAWLNGDENSLFECLKREGYDAEADFDGFDVRIKAPRGGASDKVVAYGRNMMTLNFTTDAAGLITGYVGWGRWNGIYKSTPVAYRGDYGNFAYQRIQAIDLSNEFETLPTDQELWTAITDYATAQGDAVLPTSITVTAVPDSLQDVHLCDTVTVIHPGYDLSNLSKVVKTVYDPLRERYESLTIGEIQTGITDTIARMLAGGNYEYRDISI